MAPASSPCAFFIPPFRGGECQGPAFVESDQRSTARGLFRSRGRRFRRCCLPLFTQVPGQGRLTERQLTLGNSGADSCHKMGTRGSTRPSEQCFILVTSATVSLVWEAILELG